MSAVRRARVKVTGGGGEASTAPARKRPRADADADADAAAATTSSADATTRRAAIAAAYLPPPPPPSTSTTNAHGGADGTAAPPARDRQGRLVFPGYADFRPNLTPKEVLQAGSFGGTYFRRIHSGVTGQNYEGDWREFPADWFTGLQESQFASATYTVAVNKYRAKSGQTLEAWESSGWINRQDPRGWFQWYCRFYLGRRSPDDARQIGRWLGVAGPRGRWMRNLVNQCVRGGKAFDDRSVSPVIRQLLLHWAYDPPVADFGNACARSSDLTHAVLILARS